MIFSVDIGEKNLAYCIGTKDTIIRWLKHNVVKKSKQTILESCKEVSKILEEERVFIDQCTDVVIEHQMMMTNVRATSLSQHIWTWFYTLYPDKTIIMFPSSKKTQHFLGKNRLTDKTRKIWSVTKTKEILESRKDHDNLSFLDTHEKKDDLADCFLQLVVYLEGRKI